MLAEISLFVQSLTGCYLLPPSTPEAFQFYFTITSPFSSKTGCVLGNSATVQQVSLKLFLTGS